MKRIGSNGDKNRLCEELNSNENLSSIFALLTNWISNLVFSLFLVGIFLSISRMLFMAFLAWKQQQKEIKNKPIQHFGLVSVIIPAYNEEVKQ